jgi:hypothetical protein
LFGRGLDRAELGRRHAAGARIVTCPPGGSLPDGPEMLFVISGDGRLEPVTSTAAPEPGPGSTAVLLDPAGAAGR